TASGRSLRDGRAESRPGVHGAVDGTIFTAMRSCATIARRAPIDGGPTRKVRFTRRHAVKTGRAAAAGAALARPAAVLAQEIFDMPLITKPIPSTGERLPVIGIGTNAYGVESDEALAPLRDVLTRLPELGGKVIDTAHAYGRSEEVIGRLTEEIGHRDQLFLATKTPIRGDVSDPEAALAGAFERLRTDIIDLMQIHNLHGTDVLMPAFLAAKEAGRIHYIGMSTSTDDQ